MISTSRRDRAAVAVILTAILIGAVAVAARPRVLRETGNERLRRSLLWWLASPEGPPLPDLPADVHQAFSEFRATTLTHRSRLRRPADRDFPVQAAFDKKQALERTVHGLFPLRGIESVAAEFADRVSPAYEWEGNSSGPLGELNGAERFLARYPKTPIRQYALLLIAHRSICALDALEYELKYERGDRAWNIAQQARLRQLFSKALPEAMLSDHLLIRSVAVDLERSPKCLGEN